MESRRWKDNSRILWNVLRHPERMEPDERMVQLEERSYRICYWNLYYVILVWAVFPKRSGLFSENGELYHMILIGISLIAMLVENGRFLYRCYHGIQGNKSGGSGMLNFWMNGLLAGFFWVLLAITVWGLGGWVNRLIYWSGVFFYFLLCHLAYYHYALEAEDDDPALLKKTKSVKRLFIILAVIYYVGMIGCDLAALCYRSQFTFAPSLVKISKEEQEYLVELQEGIERYYALPYVKYECSYDTDMEEPTDVYSNGMIGHSYYWKAPAQLYTQIMDGTDKVVCREFYRDGPDDWYVSYDGTWMAEQQYWVETEEGRETAPELRQKQPYTGILEIDHRMIASITKESIPEGAEYTGGHLYTVTYRDEKKNLKERSNFPDQQISESITEYYVLNAFDTLVHYQLEETGRVKNSSRKYWEQESITVVTVDADAILREMEEEIQKYSH